jgi:glycosyltransferase involved in cell wall biosynthesis
MSCGLPYVGSNVEGISAVIIDDETGVLCAKNVEDIKRGILKLFADG